MRRVLLAAGAAFVLAGPAMADVQPKAPAPQTESAFEATLAEAGAALQQGDNAHTREVLERAWHSPAFDKAPPDKRQAILLMIAALAADARDWKAARAAAIPASETPLADASIWTLRLEIARHVNAPEDAVQALTVLGKRFPAALPDLKDEIVSYWMNEASRLPDGDTKAFDLADALLKGGWTPQDPFADLSAMRANYARRLAARGRTADAEAQVRLITSQDTLITMRADKRFDTLGGTGTGRLSPKAGELARLKTVDALIKAHPDLMAGPIARTESLIALNQADKALAEIDAALARAASGPDAFTDQARKLGWAQNLRNQALRELGRNDEALEALAAGARVPEGGQPNINQTLNLSVAQVVLGQPKAALATVNSARLDLMSPYGQAVALKTKVCANAALGDDRAARTAMDALRALGEAAKGATFDALLCVGDLDAAAALVIERLKDPEQRIYTLNELQKMPPQKHGSPYSANRSAQLDKLRQRSDVLAAVAPVGRIETYRPEDLWPTP